MLITSYRRRPSSQLKVGLPDTGSSPAVVPAALDGPLGYRPVIALIEAVPVSADDLAAAVVRVLESGGSRCGVLSLDGQGRLASKLGQTARPPAWCWKQAAAELILWQGARALVAGPADEEAVETREYEAVLHRLSQQADSLVIDLGCRWSPRLFRAVLPMATHIWIITQPGKWSGVEMRLEQAEYSGWTDMTRVRIVQLGPGTMPALSLGVPLAGVLPELTGERVRDFVVREVGRKP